MELEGKAAIVTGASSGIGAAVARALGEAGAAVLLVGRDGSRLAETARGLDRERTLAVDLTADGACERVVAEALAAFGAIDVLVHAAGIYLPESFAETTLDDLDRQWAVNVRAPFALTQAALPHLDGGSVVFVSSISGHVGVGGPAYCATKGAVELMAKALALELGPRRIRVNCVAPGQIRTPMNAPFRADPEFERRVAEETPWGRWGEVEDIAPVVVFLASDAARFVHGASLVVDGGWTAR
ncbi:MAG TPA: SDR family oxidoreductase [Gaiellaceae bacterium]|nr:SDR family oxidoreductase [Gaiellaceae bacterium]